VLGKPGLALMHFSLDMWNTLIVPNPKYATIRTKILADRMGIPVDLAKSIYTSVKTDVDRLAEHKGIAYHCTTVYAILMEALAERTLMPKHSVFSLLRDLKETFEDEFFRNPPTIPDKTNRILDVALSHGHTFSIASNTNFITGRLMIGFLMSKGLPIQFSVFSDCLGLAKPHPLFYAEVAKYYQNKNDSQMNGLNSIHIGDNPICDDPGDLMPHIIIDGSTSIG